MVDTESKGLYGHFKISNCKYNNRNTPKLFYFVIELSDPHKKNSNFV